MDAMTVGVDLAKDVFEVAVAKAPGRIGERRRLTRKAFDTWLSALPAGTTVVMEACGTAHDWGRRCYARALRPVLLPPQYVRPYVRRDKTDRSDVTALLEAFRAADIHPVPVKSAAQQALQGLHGIRRQWQTARTARINTVRGWLREYGVVLPLGAKVVARQVPALIDDAATPVPALIHPVIHALVTEIRDLEARVKLLDQSLERLAQADPVAQRLQTIPGVGVIIATSLIGTVPHIHAFPRGRQFASWLGLTPRVRASGHRRFVGRISKRGDVYLRTLLTHGARSILVNAQRRARTQRPPLSALHHWGTMLATRRGQNKAASALANKLARIIWAVWRFDRDFVARPSASAA